MGGEIEGEGRGRLKGERKETKRKREMKKKNNEKREKGKFSKFCLFFRCLFVFFWGGGEGWMNGGEQGENIHSDENLIIIIG